MVGIGCGGGVGVSPWLLGTLGRTGALGLAAAAAVVRGGVLAQTADVAALAAIEPLHGLTFALFHLACMRIIADTVPPDLAGTAQALDGTVGIGGATALLTMVSGWLFAALWTLRVLGNGLSVLRGAPRHLELAPVAFRREKPAKIDFRPYVSRPISSNQAVPSALVLSRISLIGTRPVRIQPRARVDTVNLRQLTRRNSEIKGDFYKYRCRKASRRTGRRRESPVKALDAETLGYNSLPIGRVPPGAPIRNALSTTFRAVGSVLDGSLRLQFFAPIARLPTNRPLINH